MTLKVVKGTCQCGCGKVRYAVKRKGRIFWWMWFRVNNSDYATHEKASDAAHSMAVIAFQATRKIVKVL